MKLGRFVAGFALAACLFSFIPSSPRFASAAPDNTRGMAILSAIIYGDGTLSRHSGVSAVQRKSTGLYWIQFDRKIGACMYFASLANTAGEIDIGNFDATNVAVSTRTSGGANADRDFNLLVYCPE